MARTSSEADRQFIRRLKRFLPLSALIACPASAAPPWVITPTLTVEEEYTDNVTLAQSGAKRSEWATILTPGVALTFTGVDWKLVASYNPQVLYRANAGTTEVNHQFNLNSLGSIELVPQFLFLDTNSNVAQQNVSVFGPQAVSNINTTGNRATVRTAVMSPYVRHSFGVDAQAEARYTYSTVSSDAAAFDNSASNRIDLRVSSGPAYKLTTWSVAYNRETIDYDRGQAVNLENFTASGRQLITYELGLIGTVGYEKNNYVTRGEAPEGESWSVGVNWTPTPRTNLTATTGRRYFGNTYALDFRHRMRRIVFNLSYNEDVTSTRRLLTLPSSASTAAVVDSLFLSSFPDPILRQEAVQAFIAQNGLPSNLAAPVEFAANDFFLEKRWLGSIAFQGIRHSAVANVFSTSRDSQQSGTAVSGTGDFAASSTIKQTGAVASWSWRVTPFDVSNLSVSYTRNEFPGSAREDNITSLYWTLSHQFEPKLTGVLTFRRTHSDSNLGGTGNYTENAVTATLRKIF